MFSAAYTYAPEGYPELTRASPFRLASVAKSITSLGIFALIDDGVQVELKDGSVVPLGLEVNAFDIVGMPTLPEVVAGNAPLSTIGRLLSQRSGWRGGDPKAADLSQPERDRAIADALRVPLPLVNLQVQWFIEHPEVWAEPSKPLEEIGLAKDGVVPPFDRIFRYANINYCILEWVIEAASH